MSSGAMTIGHFGLRPPSDASQQDGRPTHRDGAPPLRAISAPIADAAQRDHPLEPLQEIIIRADKPEDRRCLRSPVTLSGPTVFGWKRGDCCDWAKRPTGASGPV